MNAAQLAAILTAAASLVTAIAAAIRAWRTHRQLQAHKSPPPAGQHWPPPR